MKTIITLATSRTHYSAEDAAARTLTVRDLIQELEQFDDDAPVVFSNDNGYTYGNISYGSLSEIDLTEE